MGSNTNREKNNVAKHQIIILVVVLVVGYILGTKFPSIGAPVLAKVGL